jgi:hypothetical protein
MSALGSANDLVLIVSGVTPCFVVMVGLVGNGGGRRTNDASRVEGTGRAQWIKSSRPQAGGPGECRGEGKARSKRRSRRTGRQMSWMPRRVLVRVRVGREGLEGREGMARAPGTSRGGGEGRGEEEMRWFLDGLTME